MQQAQHLARVGEIANPRVPRSVRHAVAEPGEDEGEHEHNVRRVQRDDGVRGRVAGAADDGDAALPDPVVEVVVEDGRADVAHKGGQEDERHNDIREAVVFLELQERVSLTPARVNKPPRTHT